jgi:hypothetical protein
VELSLIDIDLHLIRFYSHVLSILDILFANELMVIIGDVEIMVFKTPSVSTCYDITRIITASRKKPFYNTYGTSYV